MLKWIGYASALVVVLAGMGVSYVYLRTEPLLRKTYDQPLTTIAVPSDPASIAEGKRRHDPRLFRRLSWQWTGRRLCIR